jgi:hypothetical protein
LLVTLLIAQVLCIDGLPGGELLYREILPEEYEIAVSSNEGNSISPWVPYPLDFNPAKTNSCFNSVDMTLEVVSQRPFSANYTYAWYQIDEEGNLALFNEGEGGYYDEVTQRVHELLDADDFEGAVLEAGSVMYPGSMPEPESLCADLVIAAAEMGSIEAFQQAQEVCLLLCNCELYNLAVYSEEYLQSLRVFSELTDPYTAQMVLERLRNNE